MKTISKYILIAVACMSLSSCKKFLENEPIAQVTPDNLFTNEQGAQSAVMGMYRTLLSSSSYGQTSVIVPEFSAGHVNHVASFPEYIEFTGNTIRIDNPWIQTTWSAAYAAINAANNIILRVEEMPAAAIGTERKNQFIREAKFVRALNYFQLARAFGDVPLITAPTGETDELKVPRSPKADVYNQVITDLKEASELPNTYSNNAESKGRATGFAAKALLAKVFLYHGSVTKDYSEAARLAKEVITSGGFSLPADYETIWKTENTSESIFELQFDEQATNNLAAVSNPNASVLFYAAGKSIVDLYDSGDKRRDFTVYKNTEADPRYYIGKYRIFSPATQNFPVIRLAEVYLIHAEAQARVDGNVSADAYNSYKTVRDRAGLETPAVGSTTLDAFVKTVQLEKRRELMFEGETWFDYCRTGLALTEIMKKPDPNYYLYPVPDAERRNNPALTQNPGY